MQQQIIFFTQNKRVWRNGMENCISLFFFFPLLNKYTLNLCKSDLGKFIKLYIPSTFCCCCPSKVTLCTSSSSAINFDLVINTQWLAAEQPHLGEAAFTASPLYPRSVKLWKSYCFLFVTWWSTWVLGAAGRTERSPQSLRGEVGNTWKSSAWPQQDKCAGSGSGRQEFMNSNASSSVSLRSLECGDIMGSSAKWLTEVTEVTFCCLVDLVCRNLFSLHDMALRCFQRALGISFGELQVLPPWEVFLRSHLVFLICCPPLPVIFSLDFLKGLEVEGKQIWQLSVVS